MLHSLSCYQFPCHKCNIIKIITYFFVCCQFFQLHSKNILKVNSFSLASIYIRDNPPVTLEQNTAKVFGRDHFYKDHILLDGDSCIVDSGGELVVRLFKSIVPDYLLEKLESSSKRYKDAVLKAAQVGDCRGLHHSLKFGSYVERGGSGRIWTVKSYPHCTGFLEEIREVGQFVSDLFSRVCLEVACHVAALPEELKLWDAISLMFWNLTNVVKTHVDSRDFEWSMVLPFQHFSGGEVDLPYLNATIKAQRKDIYLIKSNKTFHNILASCNREAIVLTNHRCVVQRYCKIDLTNMYMRQ